eukprot:TRINITY_DN12291_c0_g1_i2.p1 TRINITY_DN12291_c0_g1~~TRINITY_DN12291_c0_g1_i2.p1  ORF type:complete len:114 (+),score=9.14 TRINITY_DN12291_c0_g1_i2:17-358(+)
MHICNLITYVCLLQQSILFSVSCLSSCNKIAHGYFAKYDTNRQKLFEFHQAQLEGTLERLSDITENTQWNSVFSEEVSLKRFYDLRSQVVSLTQVVSEFFGNLKTAIVQETLV